MFDSSTFELSSLGNDSCNYDNLTKDFTDKEKSDIAVRWLEKRYATNYSEFVKLSEHDIAILEECLCWYDKKFGLMFEVMLKMWQSCIELNNKLSDSEFINEVKAVFGDDISFRRYEEHKIEEDRKLEQQAEWEAKHNKIAEDPYYEDYCDSDLLSILDDERF